MKTPALVVALFAILAIAAAPPYTAKCVRVHDGDTITVRVAGSVVDRTIRLAEIDAPELKQPGGKESQAELSRLVLNRQVVIEPQTTDRYNRTVGQVLIKLPNSRQWINAQMVRDGHAWQYKQYSKSPELAKLEAEARKKKRGLWATGDAQPPWEYRKRK
ncbi:MAG: thermonuclease family protein [Pirellulales bacterium]